MLKQSLFFTALTILSALCADAGELSGTWRIELRRPGDVMLHTYFMLKHDGPNLEGTVVINGAVDLPLRKPRIEGSLATFSIDWNTDYRIQRDGEDLVVTMLYSGNRTERAVAVRVPDDEAAPPPSVPVAGGEPVPDNGLARRPPMGWSSWNHFADRVDDRTIREIADALVSSGLRDAGYVYVNIDDSWEGGRNASGDLVANSKFPDMKALADYVHSRGLKLGIYSTPGPLTCGGYEGGYGRELQDARTFAQWGVDYLKYDWCSASRVYSRQEKKAVLQRMGRALAECGRPIVYSINAGSEEVWFWGRETGANLWRTTDDIQDNWRVVSEIGFTQSELAPHAGPGHWNDPDMLEVGNGGLTNSEYRTHFSLWCLLAAPLILGNDVRTMTAETLEILSNREAIAIDQDPLGRQGRRILVRNGIEVWSKELHDGSRAVGIFNRNDDQREASLTWTELGAAGTPSELRDLWAHAERKVAGEGFSTTIPAHGVVLLRVR